MKMDERTNGRSACKTDLKGRQVAGWSSINQSVVGTSPTHAGRGVAHDAEPPIISDFVTHRVADRQTLPCTRGSQAPVRLIALHLHSSCLHLEV